MARIYKVFKLDTCDELSDYKIFYGIFENFRMVLDKLKKDNNCDEIIVTNYRDSIFDETNSDKYVIEEYIMHSPNKMGELVYYVATESKKLIVAIYMPSYVIADDE